ncbi:IS21 family transposase [Ktedonosporobacter rubrisoli]|uniref:IS21 family transposase n=1 Tax=Ktedonosporobacter rubrisoli TaxID=2509675 RepID=A0A4V0YYK6_KTERU|nr:IS21 family transposase [Ktedonosporobacter rubrisoli]
MAPVFGPYKARVDALLKQNEQLPRKQQYTSPKIFEIIRTEGYQGCESRIRQHVAEWNRTRKQEVFLPLEFEPGQDAQCDWGEAYVVLGGERKKVQIFTMRLCYSRRTFVTAFPTQKQESFLYGHVLAFNHFGGIPYRISYDNLATAVKMAFDRPKQRGRPPRQEQRAFQSFRSHYLFESHFCTVGLQGAHEKGQVEHGVGFVRRNYLVPLPEVASFEELNQLLKERCLADDERRVSRQPTTIGQAWQEERSALRPLPTFDYDCCEITTARLTPYSQATYETNRYSVPVKRARSAVTVKAYPFHVEILDGTTVLARHPRCYGREQDLFDPFHYLPLLEQRPGAFDHAKPLKKWRRDWPESYHLLLRKLREKWPEGRGIQEFVRVLMLHQDYPSEEVAQAVEQALDLGCIHLDGILHCLHQISTSPTSAPLDLSDRPDLDAVGNQPIDLSRYEQLLKQSW